jgi:amino acid transporter
MSLKTFHIVFITLSTLLALGFGGWSFGRYRESGDGTYLALAVCAVVLGVGLIAYGTWFIRKIRTHEEERRERRGRFQALKAVTTGALVWLLSGGEVPACSVCYGQAEGPMVDAARLGVWLLFGLTAAVQIAFAAFFVRLWRGARRCRRVGSTFEPRGRVEPC